MKPFLTATTTRRILRAGLVLAVGLAGCAGLFRPAVPAPPPRPGLRPDPLAVQQQQAYPETSTGRFVCLADFEDSPSGQAGHQQVGHFFLDPPGDQGQAKFVVNVTRTGSGALAVTLPPAAQLVFRVPAVHDFSNYQVLSLALYSDSLRDDLRITIKGGSQSWTSPPHLVTPGWNTILTDIRRLAQIPGFGLTAVREIRISFAEVSGPVSFYLDDIMLVDNRRPILPVPDTIRLSKAGLDYALTLPSWPGGLSLVQGDDGLWRLGRHQPILKLVGQDFASELPGEDLTKMGPRRVGKTELLENNEVRVRLSSTWYFPARAGQWVSLAVRQVRWEYTVYGDGRLVTDLQLNNSGGQDIRGAWLGLNRPAAWAQAKVSQEFLVTDFQGPIGRWSFLQAGGEADAKTFFDNYLHPEKIDLFMGVKGSFAPGDRDRDGFDEAEGCYYLLAKNGHCRFTVLPGQQGLFRPVFKIAGEWTGPVDVSVEGQAVRPVARQGGAVLFCLPGKIDRPAVVEVTGKVAE